MNPYAQSAVWLFGFTAVGYVLMELTKPSAEKLQQIRNASDRHLLNERDRKKELFMQKLSEAAGAEKPVYLKTPQQLEQENKRAASGV